MFQLYSKLKWIYQKFKVSLWMPFIALVLYTILGAYIFRFFERNGDQRSREHYRNKTSYAFDQVLERMLEVRCEDQLTKADTELQIHHAKEALFWFLDHLNLTEVISERTENTPWTWIGAMFYAGQLYTTIGYGYPTTRTTGGRVSSIFYILIGIPIFLIILKNTRKLQTNNKTEKDVENALNMIGKSDETEAKKQNATNARLHAENSFPIPIALMILVLWILFSSSLFCIWERDWGFMTSVYFFFVSISTVGLGDIVFSKPEMMIYNFVLILIGLALLSMCFNLIQAALERLLDRLLEEYIEEIEKMAEIVAQEDMEEEAMPLEFKMTGNLLALPMKRVTHDSGFLAEAKGWMAGRIANNLLASRLGPLESESESEKEEEEGEVEEMEGLHTAKVSVEAPHVMGRQLNSASPAVSRRNSGMINMNRYQFRHQKPLFNTIRTLEKIKPQQGDLRSMVFSKFIQSDRLTKLVEDTAEIRPRMATIGCQTDDRSEMNRRGRWRHSRKGSASSFSTVTNSMVVDDESLLSAAYCDVKFDYATEIPSPSDRQRSLISILRVEDDEPALISTLTSPPAWCSPPQLLIDRTSLAAVKEIPSPIPAQQKNQSDTHIPDCEGRDHDVLDHLHSICGLLPNDFDQMSQSSKSTMMDSGYDRSLMDDTTRKLPESSTNHSIEKQK